MNRSTVIALMAAKAALGASLAAGFLLSPAAPARTATAAPIPVCGVEDCSDVPAAAQPGIWTDPDTGDAYLIWTDGGTFLIVDDTVTGGVR